MKRYDISKKTAKNVPKYQRTNDEEVKAELEAHKYRLRKTGSASGAAAMKKRHAEKKLTHENDTNFKYLKYELKRTKDPSKIAAKNIALDKKIAAEQAARDKKTKKYRDSLKFDGSSYNKRAAKRAAEQIDLKFKGSFIKKREKL